VPRRGEPFSPGGSKSRSDLELLGHGVEEGAEPQLDERIRLAAG
jgi:hypothetical protein